MKNFLLGLVLGILLASVPLGYTQDIDFSKAPERINIGAATLWLGIEEKSAISKLTGLGYKLSKEGPSGPMESWIVAEKNEQTGQHDRPVGSLAFKNEGRQGTADRRSRATRQEINALPHPPAVLLIGGLGNGCSRFRAFLSAA